jgi:predicted nucleotidyltransferase component of viral defense system
MSLNHAQMRLLVITLHHLTASFKEHAILKGGMQLALFSSLRSTNDLDFVFVPFHSKKEIVDDIRKCLESMGPGTTVEVKMSSKNAKFYVSQNTTRIEVEVSVDTDVESVPVNTASLAKTYGLAPQMVRVMKPDIALGHKIAAWNERRLVRDLYDIYFWFSVQKIIPDKTTLEKRLSSITSRLPAHRRRKKMTLEELCVELNLFCEQLTPSQIEDELWTLPSEQRAGLLDTFRVQIKNLCHTLSSR